MLRCIVEKDLGNWNLGIKRINSESKHRKYFGKIGVIKEGTKEEGETHDSSELESEAGNGAPILSRPRDFSRAPADASPFVAAAPASFFNRS